MAGGTATADPGAQTTSPATDDKAREEENTTRAEDTRPGSAGRSVEPGREHTTPDVVDFATAITVNGVEYDDDGRLVATHGKHKGKPIALAADATDPDVGWTAQHGRGEKGSAPGVIDSTPDQTFHPDELPDPVAALVSGQLPQNLTGLNVDEDKFKNKKPLEP